jgi:digeranylgeranylglycerophospholipid reductase
MRRNILKEYDVIVVGAGPAGATVSRKLAEQGLTVAMLEEHTIVGIPSHCWGLLPFTSKPEITEEILREMPADIILRKYDTIRIFAPSGKIAAEIAPEGGEYLVRRDAFDRELVKQAVNAGTQLILHIRVTGIIRDNGKVIGVTTNSEKLPQLFGQIVIGADGIHAVQKGIAKWEGFIKDKADKTFTAGVTFELAGARNMELNVKEWHTGAFCKRGFVGICPIDDFSCMTDFMKVADFEKVKTGNYALSERLRNAVPVRMTGWSHPSDLGVGLTRVVDEGLILIGSAANLIGIHAAILTGRYAANIVLEAIKANDVSAKKLEKYDEFFRTQTNPHGFIKSMPFYGLADKEIEQVLFDLIGKGEFTPLLPIPL